MRAHSFFQPSYSREESNDGMHLLASVQLPFVFVSPDKKCTERTLDSGNLIERPRVRKRNREKIWAAVKKRRGTA